MARIRNRQEPVTNWLAASFLATALWVGLAAMVITGGTVPPGFGWTRHVSHSNALSCAGRQAWMCLGACIASVRARIESDRAAGSNRSRRRYAEHGDPSREEARGHEREQGKEGRRLHDALDYHEPRGQSDKVTFAIVSKIRPYGSLSAR